MSKQWYDESAAEFAANFALASTGIHKTHEPDVRIEHVEQGVYKLSVDRESIALTAQDLRDIFDWILRNMREIEREAAAADETPADWNPRPEPPMSW